MRSTSTSKSRNGLASGKSTITLNKPTIRPVTPVKISKLQKTSKGESVLNTREKALIKQNEELKKKNTELLQTLKKQKDIIKDKVMEYKAENEVMKRFAETAWPWVEMQLDEELKETIRPLIKDTTKMNSETTNCSEHRSVEKSHSSHEDAEVLKQKISSRELEVSNLTKTLKETLIENEAVTNYLRFVQMNSNVENEKTNKSKDYNKVLPGFIKSLTLSKD